VSRNTFEKISQALQEIDRPGSFCTRGRAPAVLPGLQVDGLGEIGLPLTAPQASELIKHCERAPYGKGEDTLVDTSVRRVWRMPPDRFSLKNPGWDRLIATTVSEVQDRLGLETHKLESHLYDLLLYEPGSFFLPHRDGEKLDRMVATLVVVLPSMFEGGALLIRHDGDEETIDFRGSDDNPYDIHYAAFYADCEHEVRPLESGHRLCLIYNLTLAESKKTITAPRESEHVATIAPLLREWAADDSAQRLVVTLEHEYTEKGLAWDALKGVDRARAKVLHEAARQADCNDYLALLTFHEVGTAEYAGNGRRYSRGYDDYDDGSAGDYEMGEIIESDLTANHWSDADGNPLAVGELGIHEDELLDPEALREVDPNEEFEGYTGNAGMTLEHWYRHAAIILWPTRRHFEIVCANGGKNAVPELVRIAARLGEYPAAEATALKNQCLDLARAVLTTWRERRFNRRPVDQSAEPDLLKTLGTLGDPTLIGRFFRDVLTKDASTDSGPSLATICETHGCSTFQNDLRAVMESSSSANLERNVRMLEQLCVATPRKKAGWRELCASLAQALVSAIEQTDRASADHDWAAEEADRAAVLAGLARSIILTGQSELLSRLVGHAFAMPRMYPLVPTHMTALTTLQPSLAKDLKKPCAALAGWLASCREQLESRTARQPESPKDFRREANAECKCADCAELNRFLEDPLGATHRFRAIQVRRSHVESVIRSSGCDLNCATERRGSPHTLVCTKNQASFHEKLKQYHLDLQHLATLRSIEGGLPS
jgi:2OG-Fe(II) oxygenase superfamily